MPITVSLPSDSKVPGTSTGHTSDHNKIVDAVSTLSNAIPAALLPSGDDTGAADSAALTALLDAGTPVVGLESGHFYFNEPWLPYSGLRIYGQGDANTRCTAVGCSLIDAGNSQTDTVEIDHLWLESDSTGHDLITGADCIRWN